MANYMYPTQAKIIHMVYKPILNTFSAYFVFNKNSFINSGNIIDYDKFPI